MAYEDPASIMEQTALASSIAEVSNKAKESQYYIEEKEKGIAEAQLEVENILKKLYHMLKQDVYREVEPGKMDWVEIKDPRKRVLTDEGVERILQTMNFYINKENLLSNFSEDQINRIMLTFRLALNANFFMKYNTIFRNPTLEESKDILKERLKEKQDIKKYALELGGLKVDEELIKKEVFKEIEDRIENELNKIKEEKKKENLREWELIFEQLSQMVFATLNRAWKGEERGSLRRHTNISEVLSKAGPTPREGGRFKWLNG